MSEGFWEFNLMSGKNPTHTGSFLTGYDQRAFSQEEVVAREGGQNNSQKLFTSASLSNS